MRLTKFEEQVLDDILSRTVPEIFNKIIDAYNLQSLYERYIAYLTARYFEGDKLRASINLRRLLNKFQTEENEQKQKELRGKINALRVNIKRKKKYKQDYSALVEIHNELANDHQKLNTGIEELTNRYKALQKTRRSACA